MVVVAADVAVLMAADAVVVAAADVAVVVAADVAVVAMVAKATSSKPPYNFSLKGSKHRL